MISGNGDHCILQHAGLIQPLDQKLHGLIELHICRHVGFAGLRYRHIRHLRLMLDRHLLIPEVIFHVPAHCQVVHVEGLNVPFLVRRQEIRGRLIDHLQIGFRPGMCKFIASALAVKIVAQVRMRLGAMIKFDAVVVVGFRLIALLCELVRQRKRQRVLGRFGHRPDPRLRDQPHKVEVFSVRGTDAPDRIIVIRKRKAFFLQPVQRRRIGPADREIREAFGCDQDQIFSLEHAGLVVSLLRLPLRGPSVQFRQRLFIGFITDSLIELARRKSACVQRVRRQQPEAFDRSFDLVHLGIVAVSTAVPAFSGKHQQLHQPQAQKQCRDGQADRPSVQAMQQETFPADRDHCRRAGQRDQQERQPFLQDRLPDDALKFRYLTPVKHGVGRVERPKNVIIYDLRRVDHGQRDDPRCQDIAFRSAAEQSADFCKQKRKKSRHHK